MMHRWKALILLYLGGYVGQSHDYISERNQPMYTQNGWWFLSSGGAYPPVFTVGTLGSSLLWSISQVDTL